MFSYRGHTLLHCPSLSLKARIQTLFHLRPAPLPCTDFITHSPPQFAMFFSRIFLLFTAATAVSAMTTHFGKRDVHHRRAVAARQPEPVAATPVAVVPRIRKRANGRCKASNATSSAVQATSSAPENVGNSPPTFTSSPVEHTTATPTQEPTEAPAPTTSKTPTPTPTTHQTTPTPSPTSGGGSSGGSTGATHSGDGTFYGTGLGSCGITNKDTDYIAAVSHILYDSFP